ncbi:MAG: hypothetical protein ACYS5W_18750, partial [Planctomycetota bacterium]
MQAASVAALSVALALGTSVATIAFYQQQNDLTPTASSDQADPVDALTAQVAALQKECADLRRQLQERSQGNPRRELAGLGDAQIEAAILAWLEKHGQTLPTEATAKKKKKVPTIDTRQAFLTVSDLNVSYDERLKVWDRVRKAGKLDDLIAQIREHAKKSPNDADAQAALGHALVQKINSPDVGGLERAVLGGQIDEAYGEALELNPEHWEARYSRAIGQTFWPAFTGKQAEAIQNFE